MKDDEVWEHWQRKEYWLASDFVVRVIKDRTQDSVYIEELCMEQQFWGEFFSEVK
jgi:hypothetical protein